MKNKSKNKFLLFSVVSILTMFLGIVSADAKTINKDDIPGSTYIIGTHMFTRDTNQDKGYDGKLTTNLIMLASKTIDGNSIDDMIIYYKTASGKWINGLNGTIVSAPDTFKINYTNKALEEDNDTVKAPKKPIIFWDTALTYNKDKDNFSARLSVLLDDINDQSNKVDGVELTVFQNGNFKETYDLTYDKYFKGRTSTITKDFKKNVEGIEIGNTYHSYDMDINDIIINSGYGYVTINAQAYALDENGKKVYSDLLVDSINDDEFLPTVKVKKLNATYISEDGGYYTYQLEIEKPDGWSAFSLNRDSYAYVINEEFNGQATRSYQNERFGLDDKITVTIPKNTVAHYTAAIGYYKANGDFVYRSSNENPSKTLIIDTRTLTTPTLSVDEYSSWTDRIRDGERITINNDYYKQQNEDTLDYNKEGVEFYEILAGNKYKLIENSTIWFEDVLPSYGHGVYVARVYATNAAGEKVYSDFSNKIEVVRTPELEVTDINNGKVTVSIKNLSEYGGAGCIMSGGQKNCASYKIFTEDDVELKSVESISDSITIDVNSNMKIYIKVYSNLGYGGGVVSSAKSNTIEISAPEVLYGDVNQDGEVNGKDVTLINRYLAGIESFSDVQKKLADVDADGTIDSADVQILSAYNASGYNIELPYVGHTKYKIEMDFDGGSGTIKNAYYNISDVKLSTPTKEGYVFLGWTGSNGETPELYVTIDKNTIGDLTYKANWKLQEN